MTDISLDARISALEENGGGGGGSQNGEFDYKDLTQTVQYDRVRFVLYNSKI